MNASNSIRLNSSITNFLDVHNHVEAYRTTHISTSAILNDYQNRI